MDKLVLWGSIRSHWSRFIPGNQLSQLNGSRGQWVAIDAEMVAMLRFSEQAFLASQGIFTPFLATAMEQAGYNLSYQRLPKEQSSQPNATETSLYVNPWPKSPLEWSHQDPTLVRINPLYRLDVGGIAKGWIMERTADLLMSRGFSHFVVNGGGDMVCQGHHQGRPWNIAIDDPFVPGKTLTQLQIDSLSVATSGTYRRRWRRDGKLMHHIVDPRTGEPAATDIASCTVVHHRLATAEWMAKVALILGWDEGIKWLITQSQRGWIVVRDNGEVKHAWT